MSGEHLAQSKHQISANRLHKNVRLRIGFRRRTFLWQLGKLYLSNLTRLSVNQRNFHERHARHAAKTIGNAACHNTN